MNDQYVDLWRIGLDEGGLVIDGTARRCYVMGRSSLGFQASDTVWVFTTGGQLVRIWKAGLATIHHFTLAPDGTLYITDGDVIRRFTGDGALLAAWETGNEVGGIGGLAVDGAGRVYVAGLSNHAVVRYVP